jgi:exodeoxyribonuclease VII small subunit
MAKQSFDKSYARLHEIIELIDSDKIPLEELAVHVKEAKELIAYCETKLREVETELQKQKDE